MINTDEIRKQNFDNDLDKIFIAVSDLCDEVDRLNQEILKIKTEFNEASLNNYLKKKYPESKTTIHYIDDDSVSQPEQIVEVL